MVNVEAIHAFLKENNHRKQTFSLIMENNIISTADILLLDPC